LKKARRPEHSSGPISVPEDHRWCRVLPVVTIKGPVSAGQVAWTAQRVGQLSTWAKSRKLNDPAIKKLLNPKFLAGCRSPRPLRRCYPSYGSGTNFLFPFSDYFVQESSAQVFQSEPIVSNTSVHMARWKSCARGPNRGGRHDHPDRAGPSAYCRICPSPTRPPECFPFNTL